MGSHGESTPGRCTRRGEPGGATQRPVHRRQTPSKWRPERQHVQACLAQAMTSVGRGSGCTIAPERLLVGAAAARRIFFPGTLAPISALLPLYSRGILIWEADSRNYVEWIILATANRARKLDRLPAETAARRLEPRDRLEPDQPSPPPPRCRRRYLAAAEPLPAVRLVPRTRPRGRPYCSGSTVPTRHSRTPHSPQQNCTGSTARVRRRGLTLCRAPDHAWTRTGTAIRGWVYGSRPGA